MNEPLSRSQTGLFRIFRIVFRKEMRELLRDRKSLFWLIAPPFILPGIALVAAAFIGGQTARVITSGFPVALYNADASPAFSEALKAKTTLIVTELADGAAPDPGILITLTLPDDFQAKLDSGQTALLSLTQRDSTFTTTLALGAVRSEVSVISSALREERLRVRGLDSAYLTPIQLQETTPASAESSVTASSGGQSGGLSAIFLPLAVTSWLVGGGLGLIVDTTVGEKERLTIETILVTPANRIGIVLGKLTVVFLASLLVMGLWVIEGIALSLLADVGAKITTGGDPLTLIRQSLDALGGLVIVLLILMIPFIVLLNSLVMAFCSFASSYRESNTFLFLLQLVLPALVLLSIFSIGPDAGEGWYAAPLLGTVIAIRDLFSQSLTTGRMALSVISTGVYAGMALLLASYVYSREWALARR